MVRMLGTEGTMREAIRRFHEREPADDLFAPGYLRSGEAVPFMPLMPRDETAEARAAAMHESADIRWGEVVEVRGERALTSAVWHHEGASGGSTGRFWAVYRIRGGLITEVHYFQEQAPARALLAA